MEVSLSLEEISFFQKKAQEKIAAEGWSGRNQEVKINNFSQCWLTEEAFKKILIKNKVWFRHRGLYVGDAEGAGKDFILRRDGKEIGLGLRSINHDSLEKWKTVAYPEDRFLQEPEKIADYVVVCHLEKDLVKFLGLISKEEMLRELQNSPRLYSPRNQEHFRVIKLEKFSLVQLEEFLHGLEKIS